MKFSEYRAIQTATSFWTRKHGSRKKATKASACACIRLMEKKSSILEIGCGDGYALDVFKGKGFTPSGCDIHASKIKNAASFGHNVSVQDAVNLGFKQNQFGGVYCVHTLEHTYDGYRAMSEIERVLKPGGLAFIIVPDHAGSYGNTFVQKQDLIPLEHRKLDHFESCAISDKIRENPEYRNQFPFTMKLLVQVTLDAGLEFQSVRRVKRGSATELWLVASKKDGEIPAQPLFVEHTHSPIVSWIQQLIRSFTGRYILGARNIAGHHE